MKPMESHSTNVGSLATISTGAPLKTVTKLFISIVVALVLLGIFSTAVTLAMIFGSRVIIVTTVTTTTTTSTSTSSTTTSSTTTSDTTTTTTTSTTTAITSAPTNLLGYRSYVGQIFTFTIIGTMSGSLWGTGIYTDDSTLVTAVVHSGFVSVGQTATITVQILAGQSSYTGSTQNGITSSSYGSWGGSYQILNAT